MMATVRRLLYSHKTSQEVVQGLLRCQQSKEEQFYLLELDSLESDGFVPVATLSIRLHPQGARTTLADSSEIAHCITNDGREVSLMLGHPGEQDMQPAQVILGDGHL